jgi:hypothetical protein
VTSLVKDLYQQYFILSKLGELLMTTFQNKFQTSNLPLKKKSTLLTKITVWILISLIPQLIFYTFLDKYYFTDETSVKITDINNNKKSTQKLNIEIPKDASNISVSWDCSYVSFFSGKKNLVIINTRTKEQKTVPISQSSRFISYKWLPDADIIILSQEVTVSGSNANIRFYSYDVTKEDKKDIGDYEKKGNAIISPGKNAEITIAVSPLTGTMYSKINNGKQSTLYRIDRNESITRVNLKTTKIGNFAVASHDDLIAYEDVSSGEVLTTSSKKLISFSQSSKSSLLGADNNNNIYVASGNTGNITEIHWGKLSDNSTKWEGITLNDPVDSKNLFLSMDGNIYFTQNKNTLVNVKSHKKTSYKGNFICVCIDEVISVYNNILTYTKI